MGRAFVVCDLGFGDSGKGTLTDFLVRHSGADLVVRYNGGPQAAHNVVTDEGLHHTFSQFGSGTLAGARTFLSRFMLIEPLALLRESEVLATKGISDPLRLIAIDPGCTIITPFHWLANRILERLRGPNRHGSVGRGVGEARADELAGRGITVNSFSLQRLQDIKDRKIEEMQQFRRFAPDLLVEIEAINIDDLYDSYRSILGAVQIEPWPQCNSKAVVFEGAQGVLLDETFGFAPYNTWTNCTFGNADKLLIEAGIDEVQRIGVLRSYFTRHGAGPFPTEDASLTAPELHNSTHPWMGGFRVGHFDAVLADYALDTCDHKADWLAITHMDTFPSCSIATAYQESGSLLDTSYLFDVKPVYSEQGNREEFLGSIESCLNVPILVTSHGATPGCKRFRGSEKLTRPIALTA